MIKESLFFGLKKDYEIDLEIPDKNINFKGKLHFSPNNAPCFSIKIKIIDIIRIKNLIQENNDNFKLILCNSIDNVFSLIDCKLNGMNIYPKYILKGKPFYKYEDICFNEMHFYLTNFYEWIIRDKTINFSNTDKIYKFNEKINNVKNKNIEISNSYNLDFDKSDDEKRKTLLEEYPTINISSNENTFSLDDIKDFIQDMKIFFSLLMGYPANIFFVWGTIWDKIDNTEYKKWIPIYYPDVFSNQEKLEHTVSSIVKADYISNNNKWGDIFNNFYSKEKYTEIKIIGSYLYSLLNYDDLYNFEVLGYVSILERVVNKLEKDKDKKLPDGIFNDFYKDILGKVDELIYKIEIINEVSEKIKEYEEVIESIRGYISSLQNSYFPNKKPTLNQKIENFLKKIDNRINDIINLTKDDINKIKDFRDNTAHGGIINYKQEDYYKLDTIKNKIALYLYYLVYIDFGFSNDDFIHFLYSTEHPFKKNADIKKEVINKLKK